MRPVKKALRALDNPDQTLTETEQVAKTRSCLAQIGSQIDICLEAYPDNDKKAEWRSNLWYFVSKFTNFDAKQLYKLYKFGLKKSDATKKTMKHKENVKVGLDLRCLSGKFQFLYFLSNVYFFCRILSGQ